MGFPCQLLMKNGITWDSYVGNSDCSELHGIPMWETVISRNYMGFLCPGRLTSIFIWDSYVGSRNIPLKRASV